MVIVAGHVIVHQGYRENYLGGCAAVVEQARAAPGCLDFAVSADLVDPTRVNIFERWETRQAVDAFRGSGPGDEQARMVRSGSVSEYDVSAERGLI